MHTLDILFVPDMLKKLKAVMTMYEAAAAFSQPVIPRRLMYKQ